MRTLVLILWASTTLLFGCGDRPSAPIKVPLTFHIVSAQKIEGGRFIDTSDFPKLGYIPAVPALELKQLEDVTPGTSQIERSLPTELVWSPFRRCRKAQPSI